MLHIYWPEKVSSTMRNLQYYIGFWPMSARISINDPISARPPGSADSSGEDPKSARFRPVCGGLPKSVLACALAKGPPEIGVAPRCMP